MKHLLLSGLVLSLGLCAAGSAFADLRLKPRIVVSDALITLGDVFDGAGAAAGTSLGPAPEPGQKIALRVPAVMSFVQSQGLVWQPGPAVTIILVERASQTVSLAEVGPLVDKALRRAGVDGLFSVDLRQRDLGIDLPAGKAYDLAVTAMNYDDGTGRFEAMLVARAGSVSRQVPLSGTVTRRLEVPVLARPINRGETIGRNDVTWIEVSRDEASRGVARDEDQLVGQQVRRTLPGERPVRLSDLQRPILIQKKDLVTMTVASPNMTLVMTGIAEEEGSFGDTVRLLNPKSKKTVQGIVTGPKEVRIPGNRPLQVAKN